MRGGGVSFTDPINDLLPGMTIQIQKSADYLSITAPRNNPIIVADFSADGHP